MIRKTLYGTLTQDEELNENEKAMLYIKECAELVGLEVIESETAFSITFMAEIMKRLREYPKTRHWIKTIGENGVTSAVRCSECGFEDNRYMLFRYCPNCGAKMVEQESEDE